MSIRRTAVLSVLALLVLAMPTAAEAAGPWAVQNASGKKIGYAKTGGSAYSLAKHRVYGRSGIDTAYLKYERMDGWLTHCRTATGWQPSAYVQRIGSSGWFMSPAKGSAWSGRVLKRNGRWKVYLDVNGAWELRGSAPSRCPAWLAGGAVFILLGDHWR